MKVKLVFLISPFVILFERGYSQSEFQQLSKPSIDQNSLSSWASVGGGIICKNGNYVAYYLTENPTKRSLIVQSTFSSWKKELIGASMPIFAANNGMLICKIGKDSLCLVKLGTEEVNVVAGIKDFKISGEKIDEWLIYVTNKSESNLVLRNLVTNRERDFDSVVNYQFTSDGNGLLLNVKTVLKRNILEWIDLKNEKVKILWKNGDKNYIPQKFAFDIAGRKLAFLVEKKQPDFSLYEIWYYKKGMDSAVVLIDNDSARMKENLWLANLTPEFTKDGNGLLFSFQQRNHLNTHNRAVSIDVWSYNDRTLQPIQMEELKEPIFYKTLINLKEGRIVRLEQGDEKVFGKTDAHILLRKDLGNYAQFESHWNPFAKAAFFLVSTIDGSKKLLRDSIESWDGGLGISPQGKWVIYYDFKQQNYFSYELATQKTRNITKSCATNWSDEVSDRLGTGTRLTWVPWRNTWLQNDEAVLINDNYDIWQIDPSGKKLPLNLTNGYGKKNLMKFELIIENEKLQKIPVNTKDVLIFKAFNKKTKEMGFFKKNINATGDPDSLSMDPFVYGTWNGYDSKNENPLKAENADKYLVLRMSSRESPNYFITEDFKRFSALSNVQPQKNVNWLTTELVHFFTLDKQKSTGILYKPENYDSSFKYPVIFDYYEKRSDELNLFIQPKPSEDRINISWFVSNGYLVFAPDIQYKKSGPGKSAYNSVVGAANHLVKLGLVDPKRMGIQGHSFGGYETNFIVTQTNIFAAACSASGFCNLISWYGSSARGGFPIYWAERDQGRMQDKLWDNPEKYIENSPIFGAHKVNTPLLLMNNMNDKVVPFSQGVEFFTTLRRLGKKVWMLQYDEQGHSLDYGEDAQDFNTRMLEFFNHYLKGEKPPKWMTRGIPAKLKGIDNGLQLDDEIATPKSNF